MKKKNFLIIFGLIVLICACFITCNNPIMDKWWQPEEDKGEPDYDYIAIIKDVPQLIYETIIQEKIIYETIIAEIPVIVQEYVYIDRPVPPEVLLQHIDIIGIEFIIFSGDQTEYNWPAKGTAISHLKTEELASNNDIVSFMAQSLKENDGIKLKPDGITPTDKYFLILHGHANPVLRTAAEDMELTQISNDRATATRDAIAMIYNGVPLPTEPPKPPPELPAPLPGVNRPTVMDTDPASPTCHELTTRVTTKGYGGGRNLSGPSSTYAGLNRRVEAILFTVTTDSVNSPGTPPGGTEY